MSGARTALFVTVLVLASSSAAIAEEPRVAGVPGYEALSSPAEAAGEPEAFLLELASIVEKDPSTPAARLALARLRALLGEAGGAVPALRDAWERIAARPAGDPEAHDRILGHLIEARSAAGDWKGAAEAVRRRGVIAHWLVAGPFGFTRRALHDRVFPPEIAQRAKVLDPNEELEGSAGKVRWRPVALGPLVQFVSPAERIWPVRGAAYALAQVRGERGARAVVTVECAGSFKVFWNGVEAASVDRSEAHLPREVRFLVALGEGWNRLVVKDTSARAAFSARITAADGSGPVPGLEVARDGRLEPLGEGLPPGGKAGWLAGVAGGGAATGAGLAGTASVPAESAWALAARAVLLEDAGLGAAALPLYSAAVEAEPRSAHLLWLAARAFEEADHLPENRRRNEARRLIESALARDPSFAPALERKARFHDDDGKPGEAAKTLRAVIARFPRLAQARRSALQIFRRQGWDAETLAEARALAEAEPRLAYPHVFLGELYERRDNPARALEHFRAALARDRSLAWIEERTANLLLRMGEVDRAEAIERDLLERYPGDPGRVRALADLLRTRGEARAAAALLFEAAREAGGSPALLDAAAGAALEAGNVKEALEGYRASLEAAPGDDALRRLVARLEGDPEAADFEKEFALDATPLIANAPGRETFPKASSICLLDETVSWIHRDGSQTDYVHQVFKLIDQHGIERYHTLNLPGQVLELRTIAPDGKVYEPIVTENTAEILMPKLEPGAIIEYRYRRVEAGPPAFQYDSGPFYFQDPNFSEPFVISRFVVIVDKGFPVERIQRNFPVAPVVMDRGDRVVYLWEKRESDRVDEEPMMPEKDEILPHVELVQRRSWDDIHELYRERTLGRTRLTPELEAKAKEVSGPLEGEARKARALYEFAREHVRSAFGGGPGEASEILASRSGSRLLLFKALLDAAGIRARFGVAGGNPAFSPETVWDPPRPDLLSNQVLLVEPADGPPVFVIEGGRFLPYGMLPLELHGAPVLLLDARGGEFRTMPAAPLDESRSEGLVRIALEGRAARITSRAIAREAGAYGIKERVATAARAQLRNFVEARMAQTFLGARLIDFDFPGADRPDAPFEIAATVEVPVFVEEREGRPSIRTGLDPLLLTSKFGGKPRREHPLLVRMARAQHDEVEIDLGTGYEVASLPRNVLLADEFGSYSLTFHVARSPAGETEGAPGAARGGVPGGEAGTTARVRIARTFTIVPARVDPAEYPRFLRFLREIDAAEAERIELRTR